MLLKNEILYKYRSFNCRSLSMLKNRESYFSDPKHLNDPFDCQIDIYSALKDALEHAEKENSTVKRKLQKLGNLDTIFKGIETDVKNAGVFSLSKEENNILMWTHYADSHKGFSVGFTLSDTFMKDNKANAIIGTDKVHYLEENPFYKYFLEFANCPEVPEWEEFWPSLFTMGFLAKSVPWKYENEVRILKKGPGKVRFSPDELKVVIFGLNMAFRKRQIIRKLLSGKEWRHVQMKEVIRGHNGFKLRVVNC